RFRSLFASLRIRGTDVRAGFADWHNGHVYFGAGLRRKADERTAAALWPVCASGRRRCVYALLHGAGMGGAPCVGGVARFAGTKHTDDYRTGGCVRGEFPAVSAMAAHLPS